MTPRPLHILLLLPLALAAAPTAFAQEMAPRPTPLADALAGQVRTLAVNPRDLSALISAGTLSVKLADPAAALAFFARAQAISPNDPRIAAGRAGALVLLERPGEALQLYEVAERAGLSLRPYLAERGLAYDLTGQPGHAQRDYRIALSDSRDDETIRRLALSLGVSGKRDEAMALLDPLLRKSDRAAWRARACILAIGGDAEGAERIATNMMPGASALGPFLRQLQWLSLADRAFAVHFGSLTASAARQNDARLAPAVALLPPEPAPLPPATQVAARGGAAPAAGLRDRSSRRDRRSRRGEGAQVASRTPLPTPAVAAPVSRAEAPLPTSGSGVPVQVAGLTPLPPPARSPVTSVASGMEIITPARSTAPRVRFEASAPSPVPLPSSGIAAAEVLRPASPAASPSPSPAPNTLGAPLAAAGGTGIARGSGWAESADVIPAGVGTASSATPRPVVGAGPTTATIGSSPVMPVPRTSDPAPQPMSIVSSPAPIPTTRVPRPDPARPGATPTSTAVTDERVLQPVSADPGQPVGARAQPLATPGAREPGQAPLRASPFSTPSATVATAAPAPPRSPVAPPPRRSMLDSIVGSIGVPAEELEVRRALPRVVPTVSRPASKSPAKPDAKKAKADAKADAAKPDAKKAKSDPAKAEPARWWAQVAGGANASDLGKDWRRLVAKSPVAFRGKGAWTVPSRATNRLLAGPFKTQGEAMAFVNALAKDGSSAFAWQSDAGQVVTKLAGR